MPHRMVGNAVVTQPSVGIDTSVLVRLVTGLPPEIYSYCLRRLHEVSRDGVRVVASNQAIGEAYVTVHVHYGFSRDEARASLLEVLTGDLVAPQNGQAVLDALAATGGPGLFDRLIADGYVQAGLDTLTLDRSMARLPQARLL